MRRLGTWLLLACVVIILIPKSASAHAYVVKSNPTENETLKKAPSVVKIEFDEDIQVSSFNTLYVRDTSGKRVDLKDAHIDKKNKKLLEAGLKDNLKNGLYSIQWKVISADGHPIQGVIPFRVGLAGVETETDDIQVEEMGYIPQIDMIMERGILYTSFSLFIGVLFFNLIMYKGNATSVQLRSKNIIWISLFGILISLLFNLTLQAKINADVSWLEAFNPLLLKETLQLSVFGYVWITQMVLISTLIIVTYFAVKHEKFSSFKVWSIPILLFIGLLVMKAFNSHAYGLKFKDIAVVMDFLHLLAASLWVGGLSSIILLLRKEDNKWHMYWDMIKRFSPWATGAVIVILITGLFNSTFFIPTIHSLFDTKYGLALLAKILLFIFMGILGIVHYVKGRIRAQQGLGATVKVEFVIGIIIFVIVAFMTNVQTPPMPPTGPFTESKQLDNGYELTLNVSPNKVGQNKFHIKLKDEKGQPVTDMEQMILTTQSLDMNMGKGSFKVSVVSPGEYEAEGMYINMTGNWNIHVHGLTKSLDSFDTDFKFIVGGR
ncbi:copper resistance protein [Bacillus thuringiensis]|nr:copper resistance protein [Bacillus thuringiensis]